MLTMLLVVLPTTSASAAGSTVRPNGDGTTTGWAQTGCTSTTFWDCLDDDPDAADDATSFVAAPNKTGSSMYVHLGDVPADFDSPSSVEVRTRARVERGAGGDDFIRLYQQLYAADETTTLTTESTDWQPTTAYSTTSATVNANGSSSKSAWDGARLRLRQTYGGAGKADTTAYLEITAVEVTITYTVDTSVKIIQRSYVWENDDEDAAGGDAADENTQQAAANTALTGVKRGERLNLRVQMENTGGGTSSGDRALFFDRNDGRWSRVRTAGGTPADIGPTCTSTEWQCTALDTGGDVGIEGVTVVDAAGVPWTGYWDTTNNDAKVATYVGSGGTGCATPAWNCWVLESTGSVGNYIALATDDTGQMWAAYYDATNGDLRVAQYVGAGGTGCATTAWTCITVDSTGTVGEYADMVIREGVPWISYLDRSNLDLRVARKVAGSGCADAGWTCQTVDSAGSVGFYAKMAVAPSGQIWIAHREHSAGDLRIATSAGGAGCALATWSCTTVQSANDVGQFLDIGVGPDGVPWVGYYDATGPSGRVARYVGENGTGCDVATWTCETLDGAASHFAVTHDAAGQLWMAYRYPGTVGDMKMAQYVGSGGTGCSIPSFTCAAVDSPNSVGHKSSLVFAPGGTAWLSYYDATNLDLRIARRAPSTEIRMSPSSAADTGDALNESHADMTSATDTANRDDADCVSGGTWNSGSFTEGDVVPGVSLPAGNLTPQCTEVAFSIDTSRASPGTTYRFAVAVAGTAYQGQNRWLGPASVVNYPTLTIESATPTRHAKGVVVRLPDCSAAGWGCLTVDSLNDVGLHSSIAFDRAGKPWVTYRDATSLDVRLARYVGNGGTGCATTAWTCEVLDDTGDVAPTSGSIGFDRAGVAWVAYHDATNGDLRVARFVGSGGTGCTSAAWMCVAVATTDATGSHAAIAFARSGPVVRYRNTTNGDLWVARRVGSGGTGCASSAWTCTLVAGTNDVGQHGTIAVDAAGNPWINYRDATTGTLTAARHVGGGGTGCSSPAWTCMPVDDSGDDAGSDGVIAMDASGTPWISYAVAPTSDIRVARLVGSGGTGCGTVTAWTCTTLKSENALRHASLAFDGEGKPWVPFWDSTTKDLHVARHVGSGGTGCDTVEWSCTVVDTGDVGDFTSVAFDSFGRPWVTYREGTTLDLKLATPHRSPIKPVSSSGIAHPGRSATRSDGQVRLDHGDTGRPFDSACGAVAPRAGYCGVAADDTEYDSITSVAGERPVFIAMRYSAENTGAITVEWKGRSTVAPSTGGVGIQVWRGGAAKHWESLPASTDTCAAAGANTECSVAASITTNVADYYDSVDGQYGVYARVAQAPGAQTLSTDVFTVAIASATNTAPDAAATLTQADSGNTTIPTGGSTADTTVTFGASLSDADNPDTLSLCVEVDPVGTAFSGTEDACSSSVSYSGSAVTASVSRTLSAGVDYHWQARVKDSSAAYSAWTSYGGNAETDKDFTITAATNAAPNAAASLGQLTSGNVSLAVGAWHNDGAIIFSGSVSDPDASDTLALCVEVDPVATAFSGTQDACGTGTAYSGTAVTASVTHSLAEGEYHWQVRVRDAAGAYSAWQSFGGNTESARDVGIDTAAPTAGTVYDGTSAGVDADVNNGSLTELSGNWDGYSDARSGLAAYDYAIGTTPGGTDVRDWTGNALTSSVTATALSLTTSVTYYLSVRALDAAGNAAMATADGQTVAATLGVSIAGVAAGASCGDVTTTVATSPGSFDLGRLASTSQHAIAGQNLTVTTNAAAGFTVYVSTTDGVTGARGHTLAGAPGTNASPAVWPASGTEAVGYTTSSTTLSGTATRFAGGLWAAFTTALGEILHGTGPATAGATACIATGASMAGNTPADTYTTVLRYTTVARY